MMKQVKLLILALLPLTLHAQELQIENAENFENGNVLSFQISETKGVEPQNGGENIIWDFSNLVPKENETLKEEIVLPEETTYFDLFPSSDLVEKYSDGRLVYFTKTNDKNELLGLYTPSSDMLIQYKNPLLFMKRPIAYSDSISDAYSTEYSVNHMDFKGEGQVTLVADGYGTLKLPENKIYEDVLRVKIIQEQVDSPTQYPTEVKMTTTTYVWFREENASALLKISEITSDYFNNKTVEYLLEEK